jgi:hypothetical protein
MAYHKLESILQRQIEIFFLLSELFSLHRVVVEDYCCTRPRARTNTHTHEHSHAHTHKHSHAHTHEHSHAHKLTQTHMHTWTNTSTHPPSKFTYACTSHMHLLSRTSQSWIITYNQEFLNVENNTTLSLYTYNASQRFPSLYYCTLCKPNEPQRNNGWIKGA